MDQPLALSGEPIFRVVGDEVFVLAAEGQVHWLKNPTARLIWDALTARPPGGVTARALVARVVAEFEVDEARATSDVLAFLVALQARGLIGILSAPAAATGPHPRAFASAAPPREVPSASPAPDLIDSDPGQT